MGLRRLRQQARVALVDGVDVVGVDRDRHTEAFQRSGRRVGSQFVVRVGGGALDHAVRLVLGHHAGLLEEHADASVGRRGILRHPGDPARPVAGPSRGVVPTGALPVPHHSCSGKRNGARPTGRTPSLSPSVGLPDPPDPSPEVPTLSTTGEGAQRLHAFAISLPSPVRSALSRHVPGSAQRLRRSLRRRHGPRGPR